MRSRWTGSGLLLLVLAGCGDGTGPGEAAYGIEAVAGSGQIAEVGESLPEPFEARVTDGGQPVPGVAVRWEIVSGSGARFTTASSSTDAGGITRATLQLGPDTGRYEVHARIAASSAAPASFTARAILQPVIASVSPTRVAAGEVVTITGDRFSSNAEENIVLFDGFRGTVVEATPTEVQAVVPSCVPTRTVDVTVRIGTVESEPYAPVDVTGDGAPPIDLAVGEALALTDPDEMACLRLPGTDGVAYLVVPQNANSVDGRSLPYQLVGVTGQGGGIVTALSPRPRVEALPLREAGRATAQGAWELGLRRRERSLRRAGTEFAAGVGARAAAEVPSVGDRKQFDVYNGDDGFTTITARVMYVSDHAVVYQDVNAPAGGFVEGDFETFAALFDDPIYTTDIAAFGEPSDVDGNGRIIILFTPIVNELTERGSDAGFIAGFFYGIDLYSRETYAHSNEAEVFYSMVPDPNGVHGDPRSRDLVLGTVPPVLAHEFQHMIHFEQRRRRNAPQDSLWISEALAHMAEDLVAAEFERRGDAAQADNFRRDNIERAGEYLRSPYGVSLTDVYGVGSLAERGGQWLFLKYLAGHFGGVELLRDLTQTALGGVANVEAATGVAWADLFDRWSIALWADDAPELNGAPIDPVYTFPNIDLRREISDGGAYPLQPATRRYQDYLTGGTLPVSAPLHLIFEAPAPVSGSPPPMHLAFSRAGGDAFRADDRPRWTVIRIR
ncbi:MAG TPA: IPT/TIG domain-containing protein [Longimicrobiales bacterium]